MQGLMKTPTRVGKFVPHPAEEITDQKLPKLAGTLPRLKPERFDQLAHDARNVLSALKLYCGLLAEPGVLTCGHDHYAQELQAITETASRLVERLAAPRRARSGRRGPKEPNALQEVRVSASKTNFDKAFSWGGPWHEETADDLASELCGMRPLLAAIAGPGIELEVETLPCRGRTWLSKEDLTRVMLNLVRNASEALPPGGKVRITAQYGDGLSFLADGELPGASPRSIVIAVEDSGPGIPEGLREEIFTAGFTTRDTASSWPEVPHRGLGLAIVRSLIEAAGGTARACSSPGGGARFELDLPITSGMYEILDNSGLVADSTMKGCIECP